MRMGNMRQHRSLIQIPHSDAAGRGSRRQQRGVVEHVCAKRQRRDSPGCPVAGRMTQLCDCLCVVPQEMSFQNLTQLSTKQDKQRTLSARMLCNMMRPSSQPSATTSTTGL